MAGLNFIAGGTTSCTSATAVVSTVPGAPAYLVIVNLDASSTVYVGKAGVSSSTGMPIPPGGTFAVDVADVSTIYAIGSVTVGWGVWG